MTQRTMTSIKIFFTVWLIYLLFMNIKPESTSMNLVDMGMSIVDNHNVYLRYSTESVDAAYYNGHYISGHFPGGSLPVIILYMIFKPLLSGVSGATLLNLVHMLSIVFVSTVAGALITIIFYKLLKYVNIQEGSRLLLTFLYAFGTMNFGYSTSLYKGIIATLCVFYAFYLIFDEWFGRKDRSIIYFIVGLLLGFGILTDLSVVYISLVLFFYGMYTGGLKKSFLILLGIILALIPLFIYFKLAFGQFFVNPYMYRVNPNPNMMTLPNANNFLDIFFGLKMGFFIYMPIMILSIGGIFKAIRDKDFAPEAFVIFCIFVITGLVLSGYVRKDNILQVAWPHDAHIVLRYLLPLCPFVLFSVAFIMEKINRLVLYLLGGIGVFFSYLSAQAGLLPYGIWQVEYAFKVFVTSFGMPTFFIDILPQKLGIPVLHSYLARPDISFNDILLKENSHFVMELTENQLYFFAIFISCVLLVVIIINSMWRERNA